MNIVFICHGNICRSPMAEYVMKDLVAKRGLSSAFEITSRAVSYEEIGNGIYPPAQKVLRQNNIPFGIHHAKHITRQEADNADLLICMDDDNVYRMNKIVGASNMSKVHLLLEYCGKNRDVADPWWTGRFDVAYQDILDGCVALLDSIMKNENN